MDCSLHMTYLHLHKHKKGKKYLFTLRMCSLIPRHFNCSVPPPPPLLSYFLSNSVVVQCVVIGKCLNIRLALDLKSSPNLGPIMGNLSISWLVVWPQVINKILFVRGPLSSCVNPLMSMSRDQGLNPSYAFIFFS
jgi:hypothetical protein